MINGTIDICSVCGGEVTLPGDLVDAHQSPDNRTIHLVWQHTRCARRGEREVSRRTLQACRDFSRVAQGVLDEDLRMMSEDEETLAEFAVELFKIQTPNDIPWEVHLE